MRKKKISYSNMVKIYQKADSDFYDNRKNGRELVNPYPNTTEEYYFWNSRINDLNIFFRIK